MKAISKLLLFVLLVPAAVLAVQWVGASDEFGVKEYDEFHSVLHYLQHEALPKNDLATIRARAGELTKLGTAIVKLGVPEGTKAEHVEAFKKELKNFNAVLSQYAAEAEKGTDEKLKSSYEAVHDSFERLADMLPRSAPRAVACGSLGASQHHAR